MKREVTSEELERPLVGYREAVERILAGFKPRAPERIPISGGLGLVLTEDIVAVLDVPGFDNSAMDGFAIRSSDTQGAKPVVLRLVDDLPAGSNPRITVEPGTAATIMTGAPLPPGADAVVPWEDTERRGEEVAVLVEIAPGRHVRPRGEDVQSGDTVIPAGATLGPVHVGVVASLGITHVQAVPRPRVAILSSGDELVPPGGKLMPGQVFDANRAVITALCEREGVDVAADALLPDEPDVMAEWLNEVAPRVDLIVTTGGASVGEHDWIRAILEKEGALELWRVAIKPGKPIAFGRIAGTPVLALPGNPGSAFVGMHVFVLPALRTLAARDPSGPSVDARLGAAVKGSPSRTLFCRVRLDGSTAHPLPAQSSVVLSNLLPTEGFAIIPPGGLAEGADVTVELL